MPKCSHCEKPQGRLNKGALCKECFRNKINGDINKHTSKADGDLELIDDDILKELDVYDLIKENMAQEKRHNLEIINLMEDQIELLRNEITHKNTLIETLMTELYNANLNDTNTSTVSSENKNNPSTSESNPKHNSTLNIPKEHHKCDNINAVNEGSQWTTANNNHKSHYANDHDKFNLPLTNRYQVLTIDEESDALNKIVYNDDCNIITNSCSNEKSIRGIKAGESTSNHSRRPDVINQDTKLKTVPGNSSYAKMTKQGKKICIFGASLLQPINMREFNKCLIDKHAVRNSFPGSTAAKLKYYMKPTIEDEKPDTVIINIGTNNITKSRQSAMETTNEIINIVDDCRKMGANTIFVSGLTTRNGYDRQVNAINELLWKNAGTYDYKFIDNSNIKKEHLKYDGLHLLVKGTEILANNFLHVLNSRSIFDSYY